MSERDSSGFEDRLHAARRRQGLDAADNEARAILPPASVWGVGLRVGVELVSALGVSVAIGLGLDHWLHTLPIFLCVFVLVGGAAGIVNVWRLMAPRSGSR